MITFANKLQISKTVPKEVWIGWISSLVEAYNMAIYSFTAPLLARMLFSSSSASSVFFSYSLVLIGSCFFYPMGAVYYGYLGDKQGRQKTCIYSTLGLGLATGMLGLAPIHFLGESSWMCFLVLICAQHFFSGGEYHGSIVFSLEHSNQKQKGFMSSLSCLCAVFGIVAANGLATLSLGHERWVRMCFLLGSVGGVISYFLKKFCQETPEFRSLPQKIIRGINWSAFIKEEWRKMGMVVSILAFFIVSYSFIFIFLPLIQFEQSNHFDTFKSLISYGLLLVISGLCADRIGTQKIMIIGILTFSIVIIPSCYLCKHLLCLQMILTAPASLVIGPIHGWILYQFKIENRCRGIFISSALATSIFGGSTVPICLMIFEKSHSLWACGLYPLTIALGALSCLFACRKNKQVADASKQYRVHI